MIPSFRISADFPRFRLLGFRLIFRDSFRILGDFPSFRLLGFGDICCRSVIPSFRICKLSAPYLAGEVPYCCFSFSLGQHLRFTQIVWELFKSRCLEGGGGGGGGNRLR